MDVDYGIDLNKFRWTANWLTASRLLFIPPMVIAYQLGYWEIGGAMMIATILPDWFDGPFARWQQRQYCVPLLDCTEEEKRTWWQRMNIPSVTHLGKRLDPFADKLANVLGLWQAGDGFIQQFWMIYIIVAIEFLLQCVVRPVKRYLKIGDAGANRWGQYKNQAEGWAASLIPFWRAWGWPYAEVIFPIAFGIAIVFGLLSIYGHFKPWFEQRKKRLQATDTQAM